MGIPSYYKKLVTLLPSLLQRRHPDASIDWFFLDFNCLIYHCLHRPDTPPYRPLDHDAWERELISSVVRYTRKVIRRVNPQKGVVLAIDGVVPMAKMRQQRLRRFKSAWLAKREAREEAWDKNAITPGTHFMKRLHEGLERMIQEDKGKGEWSMSSSEEPGEGEHKIMAAWRTGRYQGASAVYGLDADLIVLSLLGHPHLQGPLWLFREEIEQGAIAYDALGEEQMEWFSIDVLESWLSQGALDAAAFIMQYGCAMSVLGNDFLPSSLGLKLREEGHAELLRVLHSLTVPLLYPTTQDICMEGWYQLFTLLSQTESQRVEAFVSKKQGHARHATETALGETNWPLAHVEEGYLMVPRTRMLQSDWKKRYARFVMGQPQRAIEQYLYGIQWIWAYYQGRMSDVCFNWYYPFSLPPLWEWLRDALWNDGFPDFPGTVQIRAEEIRPVEQLALVLPLESWSLIPPGKERRFPYLAPQYYPSEFTFESVGKRYFWECEAQIPLPSIVELQARLRL